MANTIALNEEAKVKFKVGYESTLLDETTKVYKTKSPGTVYFAVKQDTVDPSKGLVGTIYYDIDDDTRIKMTADGYATNDSMNQEVVSTYIKKINYYLDPNDTTKPSDYRSATHNMITSTLGNNQPGTWVKLIGADDKYAGLLTAAEQSIGGKKTFLAEVIFNTDANFKDDVVIDKTLLVNKTLTVIENTLLSTLQTSGDVQIGEVDSLTGSLTVEGATTLKSNLIGTTATFKSGNTSNLLNADGVTTNGWFISKGNTGWKNDDFGGGWYMSDSSWIRSYGSKNIYHDNGILRTDGTFQVGENGNRFLVDTNNITLNLNTILPRTNKIIQYTAGTGESDWVQALAWYSGNAAPTSGTPAGIGWDRVGGGTSNKGLITLVPHNTTENPWDREVGLSLSENDLRFEGRRIVTAILNTQMGGPETPVYVDATGAVTAFTKTFGANDKLFWVDNGEFKTSTANVGSNKKPVYVKDGQVLECDHDIDNNAATASSVYTNVDATKKYYLAGTQLTESGNAPLYQDNNVFIDGREGHLVSLWHTIGTDIVTLAPSKSAALYVSGNSFTSGNITLKGHIDYEGTKTTKSMIRFIDNTSNINGNGISIGGGGFTVVGSGDSANNIVSAWLKPSADSKRLFLTSETDIIFFSDINSDNYNNDLGLQLTGLTFKPLVDKKGSLGEANYRWRNSYFYNNQTDYGYVTTELKVGTYDNIDEDKEKYHLATQGFISNDWVRTNGDVGWHSETYGGGIYMSDINWIRNESNKSFWINGGTANDSVSSKHVLGAQMVLANSSGGNVALEFNRNTNASWQILNSGGTLYFDNNYGTQAESKYNYRSLSLQYKTGQGAIPYLNIGKDVDAVEDDPTYKLYVHEGSTYLDGDSTISENLRVYKDIVSQMDGYDIADRSITATNANGSIQILASTNRGLYDKSNSKWVIGTNSQYGPWTPETFSIGAASSQTTNGYTLYVTGTANITNDFNVEGDTFLKGALEVIQTTKFNGDVTLGTGKNLIVGGKLTVKDTSSFEEAVTMNKALTVDGTANLNDNLNVAKNTVLTGTLEVQSTSTLTGDVTMSANASIDGTLNVSGDTTLSSALTVTLATILNGQTTINNKTTINGEFVVGTDKDATFGGDVDFLKNVLIDKDLTVTGATALNGGVDIVGELSVSSNLTVNGTTTSVGKITGNTGFEITNGDSSVQKLTINGAADLKSTLDVADATALASSLQVGGVTTLNDALNVNAAATINGAFTVGGTNDSSLGGKLLVGGDTSLNGGLSVVGESTFTGLITGTNLVLTSGADADGNKDNGPALIIGSRTGAHLEMDINELMAKASDTTTASLHLNEQGGAVYAEGLRVAKGADIGNATKPIYVDSDGKLQQCSFAFADLFTVATSNGTTNLSLTIGGTTKNITNLYARYADKVYVSTASTSTPYYVTGVANTGTEDSSQRLYTDKSIYVTSSVLYGAAWNDYAEFRKAETIEPGRVVVEDVLGEMKLSTERMQPGANIISDTYGFTIGQTEECQTPIAVAGRVLAYTYEDRNSYPLGAAVCSGPNGTVSLMTREEIREYPERIIGIVSEIPDYEVWGAGEIKVNNRIWIKI